ncbi:MAG TPA: hypothetical protein DCL21_03915, partial [Alphaproteobacteria bacterium]|nr:hypothetical protein [Alphaproteobacteria bacterium]
KKNIYTNIFDTNLNLNVHQGTQANGVKTGSIDLESNEYIKKNTEDATDANRLAKDFSNSATVIYSEENVRSNQKVESYKNMKKQATLMYQNIVKTAGTNWPCTYTSYQKDSWGRDFDYNVIDEYNAQLSYNLPWATSTKKVLPIKLPELSKDEKIKDIILDLSSPYANSYILTSSGNVWVTGDNDYGQLGIGNKVNQTSWVKSNIENVDKFYTAGATSYALKTNGEVWTTGNNSYGQLGIGSTVGSSSWVKSSITNVKNFYNYGYSLYAIKTDDELWVAGSNSSGQLGVGTSDNQTSWVKSNISNVKNFYVRDVSGSLAYVIKTNGELWSVGYNSNGQLGTGDKSNRTSWFYTGIDDAIDVFPGRTNSYVERSNGDLWGVGKNMYGELGRGDTNETLTWVNSNIDNVREMHFGMSTTYVVKNNGELWGAGVNAAGQLGIGGGGNKDEWVQSGINGVRDFYAGKSNAYTIKVNNELWAVGNNSSGQLGLGDKVNKLSWVKSNIDDVRSFSFTDYNAYVVKTNGQVWSVGSNFKGQLGIGNNTESSSWVQSNASSALKVYTISDLQSVFVLKENGDLWGAGRNEEGELGVGNKTNQTSMLEAIKKEDLIIPFSCP